MDAVLRAMLLFVLLMVLFRIFGKRGIAQLTPFDFVLLLVVGEATQQALLGEDFSLTMGLLVIATLLTMDRVLDYIGYRFPRAGKLMDSAALILVDDGRPLEDRMVKEHIGEEEILEAARQTHGLESMSQVKYAVLENNGTISIIPRS